MIDVYNCTRTSEYIYIHPENILGFEIIGRRNVVSLVYLASSWFLGLLVAEA